MPVKIKPPFQKILSLIEEFAKGNLQARQRLPDGDSELNAILSGLNMLGEELLNSKLELDAKNKDLEAITTFSPVGIFRADLIGNLLFFNDNVANIIGVPRYKLLNVGWKNYIHPDDVERIMAKRQAAFSGGEAFKEEYRFIRPEGKIIWVLGQSFLEKDDNGNVTGVIGAITDITVQKRSEWKYQELLESAPDAIVTISKNGKIEMVNKQTEKIFGYKREELIGKNLKILIPTTKRKDHDQHLKNYLKNPKQRPMSLKTELFGLRKNGELFPIEVSLSPNQIDENLLATASIRDISDRKIIERELKISEERNRAMVKGIPDLLFRVDASGKYLDYEARNENNLFVEPSRFIGKNVKEVLPPGLGEKAFCEIQKVIKTGKISVFDYDLPLEEGIKYFEARIVKSADREVLVIIRDISKRKAAEKSLTETKDKLVDALRIANLTTWELDVAHDRFVLDEEFCRVIGLEYSNDPRHAISALEYFQKYVYEKDKEKVIGEYEKALNSIDSQYESKFEYRLKVQDNIFYLLASLRILKNPKGKTIKCYGTAQDITEIKEAERSKDIINRISNELNKDIALDEFFKRMHSEVRKILPADNFYISRYEEEKDLLTRLYHIKEGKISKKKPTPRINGNGLSEYVIKRKKGLLLDGKQLVGFQEKRGLIIYGTKAISWLGVPILIDNSPVGTLAVQSFTNPVAYTKNDLKFLSFVGTQIGSFIERKKAEEEINRSQERLRALSQRLESIREEEKKNLALDLHDELGQDLTAIKLDLYLLQKKIKSHLEEGPFLKLCLDKIDGLLMGTGNTIEIVRRLTFELRPTMLDDLGPYEAIKYLLANFMKKYEIDTSFETETGDLEFDPEFSMVLYRICQESLTNILRHAKATSIEVAFYCEDARLKYKIADDGIGVDLDMINGPGKLGIFGMKERIKKWDGDLVILNKKGTTLCFGFPIDQFQKNDQDNPL